MVVVFCNQRPDASSCFEPAARPFTAEDLAGVLRERGWLGCPSGDQANQALQAWLSRAAELLGPYARDRAALASLVEPIFVYVAATVLQDPGNQDVLARAGAREVIRELASRILDGVEVDSDRFKKIVEEMKQAIPYRSRAMFYPIRLALTGRVGEGELDRVILLLDSAATLDFAVLVKTTRQRMLEFCAALD